MSLEITFFKQMAPSAGESKEQLYNMPGDDGKMAVGTMGNPNFDHLRDLWLPIFYLILCFRVPLTVWHQDIKAQNMRNADAPHIALDNTRLYNIVLVRSLAFGTWSVIFRRSKPLWNLNHHQNVFVSL